MERVADRGTGQGAGDGLGQLWARGGDHIAVGQPDLGGFLGRDVVVGLVLRLLGARIVFLRWFVAGVEAVGELLLQSGVSIGQQVVQSRGLRRAAALRRYRKFLCPWPSRSRRRHRAAGTPQRGQARQPQGRCSRLRGRWRCRRGGSSRCRSGFGGEQLLEQRIRTQLGTVGGQSVQGGRWGSALRGPRCCRLRRLRRSRGLVQRGPGTGQHGLRRVVQAGVVHYGADLAQLADQVALEVPRTGRGVQIGAHRHRVLDLRLQPTQLCTTVGGGAVRVQHGRDHQQVQLGGRRVLMCQIGFRLFDGGCAHPPLFVRRRRHRRGRHHRRTGAGVEQRRVVGSYLGQYGGDLGLGRHHQPEDRGLGRRQPLFPRVRVAGDTVDVRHGVEEVLLCRHPIPTMARTLPRAHKADNSRVHR